MIFATIGIFLIKRLSLDVCNGCHEILIIFVNLSDIAILSINGADYCSFINGISKSEAIVLLENVDFTKKGGIL